MTILDTELDPCVGFGFAGGPEFSTRITGLANGHERRNARWASPRHRWTAPFANISDSDYREIKRVFMVCRGMANGFLFKDWLDFTATNEPLGDAPSGSTAVRLAKVSTADGVDYTRNITRPLSAGFTLYQAGVAKAGTLDVDTGLFTPTTAWTEGEALTWTGEFRIPVRFANDWLPFSIDNRKGAGFAVNGSVDLIEVFGE
jgi:uncharacterized protein (TIGR02217 family)